jgi:hypothetical protein
LKNIEDSSLILADEQENVNCFRQKEKPLHRKDTGLFMC